MPVSMSSLTSRIQAQKRKPYTTKPKFPYFTHKDLSSLKANNVLLNNSEIVENQAWSVHRDATNEAV